MRNPRLCRSCGDIKYIENVICEKCKDNKVKHKPSKERVKQHRTRQKELGCLNRELHLTDSEFETLKTYLDELRKTEATNETK